MHKEKEKADIFWRYNEEGRHAKIFITVRIKSKSELAGHVTDEFAWMDGGMGLRGLTKRENC